MSPVLRRLYNAFRTVLLPGLSADDRREMDELIARRIEDASARSTGEVSVWVKELVDLFVASVKGGRGQVGSFPMFAHPSWRTRGDRIGTLMVQFLRDLRLAVRNAGRAPGFSVMVMLTLGFGIGAATAVFSVADAALIRSLPFSNADRLVAVIGGVDNPGGFIPRNSSYPEFSDWRSDNRTLDEMAAWLSFTATLALDGGTVLNVLNVEAVTQDYFEVLGAEMALGRTLSAAEHAPGGNGAIVVSRRLWENQFGADRTLVGRSVRIDDRSWEVVGVAERDFHGLSFAADVWFPVEALIDVTQRGRRGLPAVGRLQDEAEVDAASGDLKSISARLEEAYPDYHANRTVEVLPLRDYLLGSTADLLIVLLAAVGGLLLIACVNVTNLILVRSSARTRAVLVRRALGASGRRVFLQAQAETLALAMGGAVVGSVFAVVGTELLRSLTPDTMLPGYVSAGVDLRALAFAILVALGAGIVIGIVPSVRSLRTDPATGLREGGAATGGRHHGSILQPVLVMAELSLALVLLIGTGLMVRNLEARLRVDTGMDLERTIAFRVEVPENRAASAEVQPLLRTVVAELEALPSVESASWVSDLPLQNDNNAASVLLEGVAPPNDEVRVYTHRVAPGAFDALGISILSGRGIGESDRLLEDPVVVISNALARRYYGEADPIGRRILFPSSTWVRVVGVAEDVRYRDLTSDLLSEDDPDVYLAYYESLISRNVGFIVRTMGEPEAAEGPIREAAELALAGIPVQSLAPLSDGIRSATALSSFGSMLFATFGVLAGALAAVGIYGVIAVSVGLRGQEIAIRMALGARASGVLALVMRQGLLLAGLGLGLGLLVAVLASQSLEAFLFGIEPVDLPTYGVVTALLGVVALVATWLPARRATRVQPSRVLRSN